MAINFLFDVSVNSGIDLQNTSITSLATPVNSTDAATKAYVDALVTASDLDFSGTNGTGAVDLDSQVFAVTGGTFISTTASGQSLSIDLNATNTPSATTFLRGDNTWSTPPDNNTTYTFAAVSGTPNLIRLTGTNPSSTNDIGLVATGNVAITFNSATSLGFDLASSISVANTITAGTGLTVTTGGVDITGTGTFNTGISVTGNSSINGELDMSSNKIINITDPTNAQDAATKNYVDITSTSGAVNFQGGYDAATNTPDLDSNPSSAIKKGWMYTVTADGTFFTEQVRTGDSLIAQIDAPTTLANWTTVQNNIDLADASTVGIGNVAGTANDIGVSYSAGTATVSQAAVTLNQNASSVTPGSGGSFTVVDSVTTNSTGHLTDYNLKTVTLPTATISGSGTANYIPKWNTTSALTDSLIYDTGTQLAIGTTSPDSGVILQVGDGTVSEIIRVYDSGNKHIDLKGEGVLFTRNNSYLRPAGTASAQTLFIGDNFGGSNPNRSWGAIRSNFNDFWFTDNGVKVMRIHDEKVGIGTGAVYPNTASEKLHVDGNFRLTGSFKDGSNGAGTSGQVLSSTGTSTSWITLPTDNNNYVTSASFGTSTGVLTLNRQGLTAVTVSLDGRYLTGNQNIELTGDVTGGPSATSIATTISPNVVGANELNVSSNGTSGQVLTSDGLGAFTWSTPFTGDITGVTAGNGLTGGGTAGTVELTVGQGTGIQVNATNVALATAGPGAGTYGSTSDSTKIDTITLDAYGRVTGVATGATGSGSVTGSGTASYIPKWSTSSGLSNSIIYDNGTNIGISNSNPLALLDVDSWAYIDKYSAGTTSPHNAGYLKLRSQGKTGWGPGDEMGKLEFYVDDGSGVGARNAASIRAINSQGNGSTTTTFSGELSFYTSAYNQTESERMRLTDIGRLGIGYTDPDYELQVDGEIGIDSYIRHNGDSNTFMGFSANDTIKFRTAGSDRLIVFPGGGVDVYNDFTINNSSPEMYFQTGATHYRWMVAAQENVDAALEITPSTTTGGSTYSTPVAVFKATGNVGVGTTNPDQKLHLEESDTTSVFLKTENTAGALLVGNNSAGNSFVSSQTSGKDLLFETANTERLRIKSDGSIQQGNSSATGQYAAAFGQNNTASSLDAFATGEDNTSSGRQSFTAGFDNVASGNASFAVGGGTTASGENSFAACGTTVASGISSAAFGAFSEATATNAFAINGDNTASGESSFALGVTSTAQALGSIASGLNCSTGAGANGAFAGGTVSNANNQFSIAYGDTANASGRVSQALGYIVTATAQYSFAQGFNNTVNGTASAVFGQQNLSTATAAWSLSTGFLNTTRDSASLTVGSFNGMTASIASREQFMLGRYLNVPRDSSGNPSAGCLVVGEHNTYLNRVGVKFAVGTGVGVGAEADSFTVLKDGNVLMEQVVNKNYSSDSAAAAGGVPVGGIYHNSGDLKIRLT